MAVGTGGGAGGGRGGIPPPQYFANPKKCIEIWLKYVNSSVDIRNHRYTTEQNCILLKKKCD